MKRYLVIFALFAATTLLAQEKAIKPLDVPMSFSGTYGELRRNHFHGGVDWRVGGKIGDPIHVIKSGYICQVSVSVYGYGNGIYVKHNDGTMSVYGHMSAYTPKIAALVKKAQYEKKRYNVNLYFGPDDFPVKQGDIIGRVGSTGSSAGPHLHMEVRDSSNVPMNYISMGYYKPVDNIRPHIARVAFYSYDDCSPVANTFRVRNIPDPKNFSGEVNLPKESYVAIDAYDIQDGTTGKLAVEEYRVSLDDRMIFRFKVGNVGFDEGSDIKSLIEYRESYAGGRDMVKSVVDPGNSLSYKTDTLDGGLIILEDYERHTVRIEALDEHGNKAVVALPVRRDDTIQLPPADTSFNNTPVLWFTPNMVCGDGFKYLLAPGALYNSFNLRWKKTADADVQNGRLSPSWKIGDAWIPLKSSGMLIIDAEDIPAPLLSKAYIASLPGMGYAGPLSGARVGFGTYCIGVDTEGPRITVDKNNVIRVFDAFSGTESVDVEIDGKWHLSQNRGGRVTILDKGSISKGVHNLKITAIDVLGNETVWNKNVTF